jgi:hypothetical protein
MKRYLALLTVMILVLTGCGQVITVSTPTPSTTFTPITSNDGLNLLIVAQGTVRLKRDGWPDYQPTAFGTVLRRGDLLQVDAQARATVLCADLTAWPVPAGAPSGVINGCPPLQKPALVRRESLIGATKAPVDPLIPYIISPRMTCLLSRQPILRWNAVTGVTTYTISIHGVDWVTKTTTTQFVYPTDAPPLRPGVTYLLLVEADNGRASREESAPGLGFSLLEPDEAEPVRADEARLHNLALSAEAESYALAHLYAGHELVAEAVDLLEELAAGDSQEAAVYRTLGDLYHSIGLERLAEARYLRAEELAGEAGDVEGQAAALAGLGEVYASLGNKDQALVHWQQALKHYQAIGDAAQAAYVQTRIDEVK